jgi:hypothetical protein
VPDTVWTLLAELQALREPLPQGLLLRVPVAELQKEARSELLLLPQPEEEREPVSVTD